MFELLLQADRAMAEGQFERAERTYWQLIELDPGNAIALAGLARFSLERGDDRLARTLARRALSVDPESFVALRVLESLDNPGSAPQEPETKDGTLAAAERLEAVGRKRRQAIEGDRAGGYEGAAGGRGGEGSGGEGWAAEEHTVGAAGLPVPPAPAAAHLSIRAEIEAEAAGPDAVQGRRTRRPWSEERELRQKGRIAAAAAAAGEAARRREVPANPPVVPETHKVRPGKPAVIDPFAAAEMAAAVAAVDEVDLEQPAEGAAGVTEVEVAEPPETAAETSAQAVEPAERSPERAEAEPTPAEAEAIKNLRAQLAESGVDASATEAEAEAARLLEVERKALAAETAAAAAEEEDGRHTEDEAEAAALREAMAIMLGGETDAGGSEPVEAQEAAPEPTETTTAAPTDTTPVDESTVQSNPEDSGSSEPGRADSAADTDDRGESEGSAEGSADGSADDGSVDSAAKRKKGFLGLFRGQ